MGRSTQIPFNPVYTVCPSLRMECQVSQVYMCTAGFVGCMNYNVYRIKACITPGHLSFPPDKMNKYNTKN